MSDRGAELGADLQNAEAVPAILGALARAVWFNAHDGAECPDNRVPTSADLAAWLADCPDDALQDAAKRLGALYDAPARWEVATDATSTPLTLAAVVTVAVPATLRARLGDSMTARRHLVDVHAGWRETDRQPRHPLAPLVADWQARAPVDVGRATVSVVRSGSMTRRPSLVSTVRRAAWLPDVAVHGAIVDGEPVAALRADPADLFPGVRRRPRRKYRPGEQRQLPLRAGYGVAHDLRLIALQEVSAEPGANLVLANDVLTLLAYAHVVDRPMELTEHAGAALLVRDRTGRPRAVQPQHDLPRIWEAAAWLRSLLVWEPNDGYRWAPLAHVDVPRVRPVDRLTIGPPEWARNPRGGKWTLTAEGSAAASARVTAGRYGLAGRIITGLEYRLAAGWDGNRNDRRAPLLRPAYGKAGAGPVLEVPWRTVLRLAGDWWDETDARKDRAALERYKRVVNRLEAGAGERSYFVLNGAVRKAAPAGDSVEIVQRIRGHRGRPAGLLVRASARFVEAARLAQLRAGAGFEYRLLTDWAGLELPPRSGPIKAVSLSDKGRVPFR